MTEKVITIQAGVWTEKEIALDIPDLITKPIAHAYLMPGWIPVPYGTAAIVAGSLYLTPIRVTGGDLVIDGFSIFIETAGAAGTIARLGIYDGMGSGALLDVEDVVLDAGTVVTSSTGRKTIDLSATPLTLSPGWYWLALVGDGTPTIRGLIYSSNTINVAPVTTRAALSGALSDARTCVLIATGLTATDPLPTTVTPTAEDTWRRAYVWLRMVI